MHFNKKNFSAVLVVLGEQGKGQMEIEEELVFSLRQHLWGEIERWGVWISRPG